MKQLVCGECGEYLGTYNKEEHELKTEENVSINRDNENTFTMCCPTCWRKIEVEL